VKIINKVTQNRKLLGILLVAVLILTVANTQLGVLNPGFEGAKCFFYGAEFRFSPDWDGTYELHRYQDDENPLVYHEAYGQWDRYYWATGATPNDAAIGYDYDREPLLETPYSYPTLGIHVEQNLKLEDINRQGDPLGWNETDPSSGRVIEYWHKTAEKIAENETHVTYRYVYTKEKFMLIPTEFWVGFYLVPSQKNADTWSGWREGEYQNILCWFRLDFHVWDNAYRDEWEQESDGDVYVTKFNGTITRKDKTLLYRGGFPIAGWIQGWEKAGWTSSMSEEEAPVWATLKGNKEGSYTANQLGDLKDDLMAKVQFAPGLVGSFISLYSEPDTKFSYVELEPDSLDDSTLVEEVKSPDSRIKKIMYFPINILNFGTLAVGDVINGYTIYYPSAYFRIRMIYGVYGTFTYLWTEEVTKPMDEGGLDYSDKFERHGTTVIHVKGAASWFEWTGGVADWFTNPFNQLWTFFIIMVIVMVVVTVFNPGVWTVALSALRRGKRRR